MSSGSRSMRRTNRWVLEKFTGGKFAGAVGYPLAVYCFGIVGLTCAQENGEM